VVMLNTTIIELLRLSAGYAFRFSGMLISDGQEESVEEVCGEIFVFKPDTFKLSGIESGD
jgi:hypothetical protein